MRVKTIEDAFAWLDEQMQLKGLDTDRFNLYKWVREEIELGVLERVREYLMNCNPFTEINILEILDILRRTKRVIDYEEMGFKMSLNTIRETVFAVLKPFVNIADAEGNMITIRECYSPRVIIREYLDNVHYGKIHKNYVAVFPDYGWDAHGIVYMYCFDDENGIAICDYNDLIKTTHPTNGEECGYNEFVEQLQNSFGRKDIAIIKKRPRNLILPKKE